MLNRVYIGLGSNLGRSVENICGAVGMMQEFAFDLRTSPLYRTSPVGFRNQPAFYNAVCSLVTRLTPFELMERLLSVEQSVGRRRTFRNAPRLLDIDILFFGRLVLVSPPLVVPHPRLTDRIFVLRPLADIAPLLMHPVHHLTVRQLLEGKAGGASQLERVAWQQRGLVQES